MQNSVPTLKEVLQNVLIIHVNKQYKYTFKNMVTKRIKGYEDLDNNGPKINHVLDPDCVVPQEIEMASVSVIPDGNNKEYICSIKFLYYLKLADTFTVAQAVNALGFGWFQVKLSFWTGLCWMADSMEMTILSILSPALHCDWQITR